MNILSIETSCDETAISIIRSHNDQQSPNFKVLSDLVISQIETHAEYGGVFPALAKREHAKNLIPLLEQSLKEANLFHHRDNNDIESKKQELASILEREPDLFGKFIEVLGSIERPDIDIIMVTYGPGLAPALWVGVNFARALSIAWDIPVIPVNHMEGHITSILLKDDYKNQNEALYPIDSFEFPIIALLISGGHTQLVLVRDWSNYEIIGETIDDAVGEAFDKVARMLGMEYPGGPKISKSAEHGEENADVTLPRPMIHSGDYRFSFSGLKTAVRYLVEDLQDQNKFDDQTISDIAREFEHAVTEVLIKKTKDAMIEYNAKGLIIAGGVSANRHITESFTTMLHDEFPDTSIYLPEKHMCGDNSLMIAVAGFINYLKHKKTAMKPQDEIMAVGNLKL